MSQEEVQPHGVINQQHINRRTDYLFRISLKALIWNERGQVLVVKEIGRTWWDLPGGGMDHNESIKDALARELYEEVGLNGDFTYEIIAVEEPKLLPDPNVWQMRLVFSVVPTQKSFQPGDEGDEVMFIDPAELKASDNNAERKVYEYARVARKHA